MSWWQDITCWTWPARVFDAAAVAWHENRRKWVGDQSDKSKRVTKEPVIWYNFSVEKFPLGDITISIFAKIDPWIFHMQLVDGLWWFAVNKWSFSEANPFASKLLITLIFNDYHVKFSLFMLMLILVWGMTCLFNFEMILFAYASWSLNCPWKFQVHLSAVF